MAAVRCKHTLGRGYFQKLNRMTSVIVCVYDTPSVGRNVMNLSNPLSRTNHGARVTSGTNERRHTQVHWKWMALEYENS